MRVYYGLDLLLSKLSKAQSNGKFRERHSVYETTWVAGCEATNRTVIRDEYEKEAGPLSMGGGRG